MIKRCGLLFAAFTIVIASACTTNEARDPFELEISKVTGLTLETQPKVLLSNLNNAASPAYIDGELFFAESASGNIYKYRDGKAIPIISDFGLDDHAGYDISVMGIEEIAGTSYLAIASAAGAGDILLFDRTTFPTSADSGKKIPIKRVEDANPFAVEYIPAIGDKGPILTATGGTAAAYGSNEFEVTNPPDLRPIFEVETGIAGMDYDPKTGLIYAAVTGTGGDDGSIIRWRPHDANIKREEVATGLTNPVDVLVLANGTLLAVEFGTFGKSNSGTVSLISPRSKRPVQTFINGLNAPSGIASRSDGTVAVTTFGADPNAKSGKIVSFQIKEAAQ